MFSLNGCSSDFFYKGRNEVEGKQSRYLNEERMALVQRYLENTGDTGNLTTGTSDDGIGSYSEPSDLTLEEPGGKSKSLVFAGY